MVATELQPCPLQAEAVTSSTSLPPPYPTTIYPPPYTTFTERRLSVGLTLGVEAALDVTKSIAVVPDIRMTTLSQPYNGTAMFLIRPGVRGALGVLSPEGRQSDASQICTS